MLENSLSAQFFHPLSYKFIVLGLLGLYPIPFGFGLQFVTLQLAPSVEKTSACKDYNGYGGSGPHQTSSHHAESANIHHQQGELHNLEHGNHMDNQQEGSSQTLHAGGSGY